jgi:integrase
VVVESVLIEGTDGGDLLVVGVDVPATCAAYRSHLRLHNLPHLGHLPLNRIRRQHIKALVVGLKTTLARRSTEDVLMVASLVLREAVEDGRIPYNPARGVKVGGAESPERPHATAHQITQIVARIPRRIDQVLVITAAYTGMRWGELTGLDRTNTDLDHADIYIHPDVGALHEISGDLFLGPPKNTASVRHTRLPDFLVQLLAEILASQDHPTVFPEPGPPRHLTTPPPDKQRAGRRINAGPLHAYAEPTQNIDNNDRRTHRS